MTRLQSGVLSKALWHRMKGDLRSFRVALVADEYVNPSPDGIDGLAILAQDGWGILQLPSDDYPLGTAGRMLAKVAEQAEEFSRHAYELILVGEREGLVTALAAVGIATPDQVVPSNSAELVRFLKGRPRRQSQ